MASAIWRLLAIPGILLALFLIGAPDLTAPAADSAQPSAIQPSAVQPVTPPHASTSRGPLVPLYISLAALEALDVHTTLTALDRGAVEANPMMGGLVQNKAAFIAVKAASAAGAIYLADRMRVHNRLGAIMLMAGFNSLYATVVAHNYSVLNSLR